MGRHERLFVAVGVPGDVRARLAEAVDPLRAQWPSLRWVRPDAWHVTLAFIGDSSPARAAAVDEAAVCAAAGVRAFEARLSGDLGAFGRSVLWAGLAPSPPLARLARGVRGALADRGVSTDDKPFHAHLTLARAPRRGRLPSMAEAAGWRGPTSGWAIDRLDVRRSEPAQGGARYPLRLGASLVSQA